MNGLAMELFYSSNERWASESLEGCFCSLLEKERPGDEKDTNVVFYQKLDFELPP